MEVRSPERKATLTDQRQFILTYLGFKKLGKQTSIDFEQWVEDCARRGELPDSIIPGAQSYLLSKKIIAPGCSNPRYFGHGSKTSYFST